MFSNYTLKGGGRRGKHWRESGQDDRSILDYHPPLPIAFVLTILISFSVGKFPASRFNIYRGESDSDWKRTLDPNRTEIEIGCRIHSIALVFRALCVIIYSCKRMSEKIIDFVEINRINRKRVKNRQRIFESNPSASKFGALFPFFTSTFHTRCSRNLCLTSFQFLNGLELNFSKRAHQWRR